MLRNFIVAMVVLIIGLLPVKAQRDYSVDAISADMRKNANAVIRTQQAIVELDQVDKMQITNRVVVTVFNKRGLTTIQPAVQYDNSSSIQDISANVYDKHGKLIKKYKKKDFVDISVSGINLYSDDRAMVLEYTPAFYPFTFEFISSKRTKSTGFLPWWDPMPYYRVSTEQSTYELRNPNSIPLTVKAFNLEEFNVQTTETPTMLKYTVENIPAIDHEPMGPHFTEYMPFVRIAPMNFELRGVKASIRDWRDFGLWQERQLLTGRRNLSPATLAKVDQLVNDISDTREKVRTIYEYMQSKTRYISVQVGIGGWQPTRAEEVDRLGYGDCKGLTNYTRALLESQGIESYYTIVNAGVNGRDLIEDFVAIQGNHVILTVPLDDELVFLECTSQDIPFNYLGVHTDNRKALMITPEGGVMTQTHEYGPEDNLEAISGQVTLQESLVVSGKVEQASSGIEYNYRYRLMNAKSDELDSSYKHSWSHLNDLSLNDIEFNNDKENVVFEESLRFETSGYLSKAGSRILLNPNIFRRIEDIPSKSKKRTQPVVIRRGFTERDEIEWHIPQSFEIESAFKPIELNSKFGTYKATITEITPDKYLYKREFVVNSGRYPKEAFNEYVEFIKQVAKLDRSKIVLIKK